MKSLLPKIQTEPKVAGVGIRIGFSEKRVILVAVSSAALLVISCWLVSAFISPRLSRLSATLERHDASKRILEIKNKNLEELGDNKARISAMDSDKTGGLIPDESQAPDALVFLSKELAKKNIRETGFYIDPAEDISLDGLPEGSHLLSQPVTVTGIGKYDDVMAYLNAIQDARHYYKPSSYVMTSRDMLRRGSVQLTVKLDIFVLRESGGNRHWTPELPGIEKRNKNNGIDPFYYQN